MLRVLAIVIGGGVLAGEIPDVGSPNQCVEWSAADSSDIRPVPFSTNPVPTYPKLLFDAGIGDTLVVRFVVGAYGAIVPSSYCVERRLGF
jgi:hypothetical protein